MRCWRGTGPSPWAEEPGIGESGQGISMRESAQHSEDELSVAQDLEFQRRWWRFEQVIWVIFAAILALDLSGLMGQGPLSKARAQTEHGAMQVNYQRIERYGTPSILTVQFGPGAVQDGKVALWVSDTMLQRLGARRVSPEPERSLIDTRGVLYTWRASKNPKFASFALKPMDVGTTKFTIVLPATGGEIRRSIFVMP